MRKLFSLMITAVIAVSTTLQTQPILTVVGVVQDELTALPASVGISVFDIQGKRIATTRSNSKDGYYLVTGLKAGESYKFKVEDKVFLNSEFGFDCPNTGRYQELSKDILVVPRKSGSRIPLPIPPFELRKTKLRVGAEELLEEFLVLLKSNPELEFDILSFPDAAGDESAAMASTQSRAEAIKQYFVKSGIAVTRLNAKGSKSTDPENVPPVTKSAKGKRYVGPVYFVVVKS